MRDADSSPNPTPHRMTRRGWLTTAAASAAAVFTSPQSWASEPALRTAAAAPVALKVRAAKPAAVFDPDRALGSSMDILSVPEIERVYRPDVVKTCLSAGWGPITYRLNTELKAEAWHWNPRGQWSDAARQQGYLVGDAEPQEPIRDSFGYRLPHRGYTRRGGSWQGYSRLNDGDPTTYWKSNPYLASHFTGENDALHPQWVMVDLGEYYPVDAVRIDWAEPSARVYQVEYWVGADPLNWEEPAMDGDGEGGDYLPVSRQAMGNWVPFVHGRVKDGKGGTVTLKLADKPAFTRYVRVVMTASNPRPAAGHDPHDIRSRLGYAIHEVYVGRLEPSGRFDDLVVHSRDERQQTITFCSSIDPWHRASDKVPVRAQTGLDLFFTSGVTNHLPAMIPVAVVYSTPEDAAAEVAYMKKRGYALGWVEMGEECDGQYMLPEDYATLYVQFADAIHKAAPAARLGGPAFQGIRQDVSVWADAQGRTSWCGRFLDYLKAHGKLPDLAFVSFEVYPFSSRTMQWNDLYRVPALARERLQTFWNDGLPKSVPLMNTESNLCGSLSRWMTDIFSALWLADSVGCFFLEGGAAYYHSPIQPGGINHGGQGWGTWGNFIWGPNDTVTGFTPFYWGSRLINLEWVKHGIGAHRLYRVDGTLEDAAGNALVGAYAVERPDGQWALMLVNRDRQQPHDVTIAFPAPASTGYFKGPVRMVTYGSEQYVWHGEPSLTREQAHADPQEPPRESTIHAGRGQAVTLPKSSVTILRGQIAK